MKQRLPILVGIAVAMALPSKAEEIIHDGLRYTVLEGTEVRVDGFAGDESTSALVIPGEVSDGTTTYTVVSVGDEAFRLAGLQSVSLPESVRSIGREAFSFNMLMTECALPSGLQSVGDYAFRRCFSAVLNLPPTMTHVGEGAFWECSKISEVTLPAGAEIGPNAFMYCTGVTTLTLAGAPSSVGDCGLSFNSLREFTVISDTPPAFTPEDVFAYGRNENRNYEWTLELENVTLRVPESSVETYRTNRDWCVFTNIEGITEETVTEFTSEPFVYKVNDDGSVSVKTYVGNDPHAIIPATVEYKDKEYSVSRISENAFANSKVESVEIAESVREIGANAFIYCESLAEVVLHQGLVSIREKAFYSTGLENITLPAGLVEVDEFAFSKCERLKEVSIPEGVTIQGNAFNGCPLEKVTVGGNAEIASGAMFSMSLREIECLAEAVPDIYPVDVWLFDGNENFNDQVVLIVKDEAMAQEFRSTPQWDMFKGIIPVGTEYDKEAPYLAENEITSIEELNLSSGLKAFVPRRYSLQFLTRFKDDSSIIVWDGEYGMRLKDYTFYSASMQQWWDNYQKGDHLNGYLIGVNSDLENAFLVTSHSVRNVTIMPDVVPLSLTGTEATEMTDNGRYLHEYCYMEILGQLSGSNFISNDNVAFEIVDIDNVSFSSPTVEGDVQIKGILFNGAPYGEEPTPRLVIIDQNDYYETGIGHVDMDAESSHFEIYNLTGTAMGADIDALEPGIYVRNGKKIIIIQ